MDEETYNQMNDFICSYNDEFDEDFSWDVEELEDGFKVTVNKLLNCDKLDEIVETIENFTNSKLKTQVFVGNTHCFILEYI